MIFCDAPDFAIEGIFCPYCGGVVRLPAWTDKNGALLDWLAPPIEEEREWRILFTLLRDPPRGFIATEQLLKADTQEIRLTATLTMGTEKVSLNSSWTAAPENDRTRAGNLEIFIPSNIVLKPGSVLELSCLLFPTSGPWLDFHYRQRMLLHSVDKMVVNSSDPRFESKDASEPTVLVFDPDLCDEPLELILNATPALLSADRAVIAGDQPCSMRRALPPVVRAGSELRVSIPSRYLLELCTDEGKQARLALFQKDDPVAVFPLRLKRMRPGLIPSQSALKFEFPDGVSWFKVGVQLQHPIRIKRNMWDDRFSFDVYATGTSGLMATFEMVEVGPNAYNFVAKLKPDCIKLLPKDELAPVLSHRGIIKLVLKNKNNVRDGKEQKPVVVLASLTVELIVHGKRQIKWLGLDFGTTNTAAARLMEQDLEHLFSAPPCDPRDGVDAPSAISYFVSSGRIDFSANGTTFGKDASGQQDSKFFRSEFKTELLNLAREIAHPNQELCPGIELSAAKVTEDYLFLFLRAVLTETPIDGCRVGKLVFTFPVTAPPSYLQQMTAILRSAVDRLGMKDTVIERACDEATAGGLCWFTHLANKGQIDAVNGPFRLLVYDYGGGTTDTSLIQFELKEGKWEVRVLGVAGIALCGGEDVNWRMSRALLQAALDNNEACIQPGKPMGKAAEQALNTSRQTRAQWRNLCPTLFEHVGRRKIAAIRDFGASELTASELAILPASNVPCIKQSGDHVDRDARSPKGNYASIDFGDLAYRNDGFQQALDEKEDERLRGRWFFNFGAVDSRLEESILHEPEEAIKTARHMVEYIIGKDKKVDRILVIGQASQAKHFREILTAALKSLSASMPDFLNRDSRSTEVDPKTCVAQGACIYSAFSDFYTVVPTLLRPIEFLRQAPVAKLSTRIRVLPPDADRNRAYPAAPERAGELISEMNRKQDGFVVNATFHHVGAGMVLTRLPHPNQAPSFPEQCNPQALVADPAKTEYGDSPAMPREVRALVEGLRSSNTNGNLYFVIWPHNSPGAAWVYTFFD